MTTGWPTGARARASRLPLRVRLVAGFTGAMLIVLTGAGIFVYWRVQYALDRRLDTELVGEAAALRPLVAPDGTLMSAAGVAGLAAGDYQVLDADGHVLSGGLGLGARRLLDRATVGAALGGPVYRDVGGLVPITKRPLRLRATPLHDAGPAAVLVVAVRRDQRDEALRELVAQLLVAGLGTLAVTAVVGERLAKAALAPVERYRARAQSIAAGASGVRLDVPPGREDEVTRLGHTLNDMLTALERSLARERRFVHDASHELRTPLTLLATRVQLALRRPRSPLEHQEVLEQLRTDIAALAALAEQLLALGAVLDGPPPSASPDAPGGDVARVVAALAPVQDGQDPGASLLPATWSVDSPVPGTTPVAVPDAALRQVLLNLLTNAAVHGGPPVRVAVRRVARPEGDVVVLSVTDAGPGVPAVFLPTAAERFARTDTARDRPGAGLGLSLVHAVVQRCGGQLRLCSAGVHHRYDTALDDTRLDLPCTHPPAGTTASVLLRVVGLLPSLRPPVPAERQAC